MVVANSLSHGQLIQLEQHSRTKFGEYTNGQKILLVGEGNFTFSAALATRLGGEKICATSLDSYGTVVGKYGTLAQDALKTLQSTGAKIQHGVDVTEKGTMLKVVDHTTSNDSGSNVQEEHKFDVIVFNFPHCGGSTQEDIERNREMLKGFFSVSKLLLRPGNGEVHIRLRDTPFYNSWNIEDIASPVGFFLRKKTPFESLQDFVELGYQEARTNPGVRAAPTLDRALSYIFSLKNQSTGVKRNKQRRISGKRKK